MLLIGDITDPLLVRVLTAPIAGSVLVGFMALCTLRWHRNETRRKALSEMLRSYVKAAQQLKRASDARLKCERVARSFMPSEKQQQQQQLQIAQATINQLQERYSHHISEGLDAFTNFEAEYAANKFRFRPMTNVIITEALEELSKLGEAVNAGNFAGVETRVGTVRELHSELNEIARRLGARSLRTIVSRFFFGRRQRPGTPPLLTADEMEEVLALVHKRMTTQATASFKVYPPQYFLDHPEAISQAVLPPELEVGRFFVLFQDGATAALTLPQLVIFTHQLLFLAVESEQLLKQLKGAQIGDVEVNLQATLEPDALMKPEIRTLILTKVDFAKQSSESMMPDASKQALQTFDASMRCARRTLSASPNHSVHYRELSFGRWQLHLLLAEDRTRRNVKLKEKRRQLKESVGVPKPSSTPRLKPDYPAF